MAQTGKSERRGIAAVAALAGVSATTVSHALSGRRPVSSATRARVQKAIEQLGYRPNQLAASLRTQRTHTVALVIPDITNPYYPMVARGLQDVLGPADYHSVICNTDGDHDTELGYLEEMSARAVDGVVIASFRTDPVEFKTALDVGIPVVMLGGTFDPQIADLVMSDDRTGTREATEYLLKRGISRIGFIDGESGVGPGDQRVAGYHDALRGHGLRADPDLLVTTDYTRQGGVDGLSRLLGLPEPPRAVLCANDMIAIGALGVARDRGLSVPEDLAIVGFDDIEAASLVTPALTTVVNPGYELGQACGRLLLSRINEDVPEPRVQIVIPSRFIVRASA
jgi:LacI family transcriptional regulator, galactose operon repressor